MTWSVDAQARRVDPISRSSLSYSVETHALEGVVTQDDYDNVEQPYDAERDETAGTTHLILTNKERSMAADLFSTSVITNYHPPSTKYGTYASSDPISDFKTAKKTQFCRTLESAQTLRSWAEKSRIPWCTILNWRTSSDSNTTRSETFLMLSWRWFWVLKAWSLQTRLTTLQRRPNSSTCTDLGRLDSVLREAKKQPLSTKSLWDTKSKWRLKWIALCTSILWITPTNCQRHHRSRVLSNKIVNVGAGYLLDSVL